MTVADYVASAGRRRFEIKLLSHHLLEIDGKRIEFDFMPLHSGSFSLIVGTSSYVVEVASADRSCRSDNATEDSLLGNIVTVGIRGTKHIVTVDDARSLRLKTLSSKPRDPGSSLVVQAQMPGLISRLEIHVGDVVTKGQGLLVLEAMKMENEIRATAKGRVKAIHVEKGRVVEKGERLVTIAEL